VTQSILITYLRLNLLELDGDDTRLHKLGAAASELADDFARTPEDALPVFLACLKNDGDDSSAFDGVANAIGNHWVTYNGAFKNGTPTTLYRAVTFQALVEAIEIQPVLGTAISLLMRNLGPCAEIGKNRVALDMLVQASDAAYQLEYAESMGPRPGKAPIAPPAAKPVKTSRADIRKRLEAAVGPHNRDSEPGKDPNPNFPSANNVWSHDFSDRLTTILADYIDTANKWASDLDATNLQASTNSVGAFVTAHATRLQNATSLLWWRQALYSESAEQPYRELLPAEAVVHAVVDLAALTPPAYERALESFLIETILSVIPSQEEVAGEEFQKIASKASSAVSASIEYVPPNGLLLSAITRPDSAPHQQVSLPWSKWAVWLLREIKAMQALENPREVPEREDSDKEEANE